MAVVLVVDDERPVLELVCRELSARGHQTVAADTAERAVELARRVAPNLAVVDLRLGAGMDGVALFRTLKAEHPALLGVMLTGFASFQSALESGQAGFADYVTKPFAAGDLATSVDGVLAMHRLPAHPPPGGDAAVEPRGFDGMVGASPPMLALFERIVTIAPLDQTVLILGETGAGKELVARSIHMRSRRNAGPFVAVTCPAVPANLFENELFGHERGAFTDARDAKPGVFERARGGTVFLDEIGDLPLEAQAKLLRVVEQREVTRLGGARAIPIDVRIVAATNVDLKQAVAQHAFRSDLYWRLNAITLRVPAVRERGDDVRDLVEHFLARLKLELRRPAVVLATKARQALLAHDWPGNVREVEHTLRDALLAARGDVVEVPNLRLSPTARPTGHQLDHPPLPDGPTLKEIVRVETGRNERNAIERVLADCRGNQTEAARRLGIDPRTLYTKMRRYGL